MITARFTNETGGMKGATKAPKPKTLGGTLGLELGLGGRKACEGHAIG